MLHLQNDLVESIQQDRQREAAAERLNASMRRSQGSRRRSFVLPSIITNTRRATRSTVPRTAA